jgi:hypothetical protein
MEKVIVYPVDTVVRLKKTGEFALIKNRVFLLNGSILHYEGLIESKGDGKNYYLGRNEDLDLEALPPGNITTPDEATFSGSTPSEDSEL